MLRQGQWLTACILALAATAAGFSWYWNVQTTRHCLNFWGPEAALRIASASQARLERLGPGDSASSEISPRPNGRDLNSAEAQVDVSQARGFSNVRRLLVQDRSFDWTNRSLPPPNWTLALRFDDGKASSLILLDPDTGQVALEGAAGTAVLDPAAARIMADFAAEQFTASNSPAAKPRE